jgi:hypothetical protein
MKLVARLAALALAALFLVVPAHAGEKPTSGDAPIGLRGFLLRADEPKQHVDSFARTPSFAWSPVRGAQRYEFELSTSSPRRENSIVYRNTELRSPTASVPISLPWITGKPYSLYARVRAVLPTKVTPWSEPYGFNMTPPPPPQPLSTFPGLLRWSPVDGATSYDVWLGEPRKVFSVNTNVADQREYYTFHQGAQWTSSVNWRVRAVRTLYGERKNGLPAVSYGAWSPVYTAVNPPFWTGDLVLSATVSDVISDDSETTPAHGLMPGFVYSGARSIFNTAEELYRVYVFTDRGCLNPVYRGAIVGSPAYAPRPLGPLALPHNQADLTKARSSYLRDGDEGKTYAADGMLVKTTESEPPVKSGEATAEGTKDGSSGSKGGTSEGSSATGGQAGSGTSVPKEQTKSGAPVDLWDTDYWPQGGYWWTAVPVEVVPPDEFETVLAGAAAKGATTIELAAVAGLVAGDGLTVGIGSNLETVKVLSVAGSTVTLSTALVNGHAADEPVERPGSQLEYRDVELTQEACKERVLRFGKKSAPALMANGAPFVSGLSPSGRLIAASQRSSVFYGSPLVAWAPALGADAYEVQWSRAAYPFRPQASGSKDGSVGLQTFATSATLPLKPGTWYYRVRGVNFAVPGGANRMSWSDPVKIVVARPRFAIVK